MTEKLRVVMFGGGYGEVHLRNLTRRSDVQIAGVWSRRMSAAAELARKYGAPVATADLDELFSLPNVDAACIATPPYLIRKIALGSIERGWHVLAEKPLGLTSVEAAEMLDAAATAEVVHMTNFDFRPVPDAQALHAFLADGHLGSPISTRSLWLSNRQTASEPWNWRHSRAFAGFGVLRAKHHVLDEIHWHFGPVARVAATLRTFAPTRSDLANGRQVVQDVEDEASCLIETVSGGHINLLINWSVPSTYHRLIECIGPNGRVAMTTTGRDRTNTTIRTTLGDNPETDVAAVSGEHPTTHDSFIDAIHDRTKTVPTSFKEGVAALALAEALRRSSDERCWIDLSPEYRQLIPCPPYFGRQRD